MVATKNLLFIIPELSMGGAQRSMLNIASGLAASYSVHLVVFDSIHAFGARTNIKIHSLNVKSSSNYFDKLRAFFQRVIRLRRLKADLKIDVSISFLEGADYVNILSRKKEQVILGIRGSKLFDEHLVRSNFEFRKFLMRWLYPNADKIVCVNQGIFNEMQEAYRIDPSKLVVIPNFYDLEKIQSKGDLPIPAVLEKFFVDKIVMAMSGRLATEKGNLFVLEIFAKLRTTYPQLRLIFIGDGPELDKILARCNSLNLTVSYSELTDGPVDVFITGEVDNVFSYLRRSSMYILNSSSEGFPNGLAEAMACGLPVISSDCPYGPREILAPDTLRTELKSKEHAAYGILVPIANGNSDEVKTIWMDAIATYIDSEDLAASYAKNAKKRMKDFSKDKIFMQWIDLIDGAPI